MERRSKSNASKSDTKTKKTEDTNTQSNGANTLEGKFFTWKKKSKPFKQFPFLDNYLFSEFLNSAIPITNGIENGPAAASRLKDSLKYFNVIKYIEQHSDSNELDAMLHNVAFLYNVEKEALKKEVIPIKKSIKKPPKTMMIEQYIRQLIEKEAPKIDVIKDDAPEIIDLSSPKSKTTASAGKKSRQKTQNGTGVDLKEISNVEDLTLIKKNGKRGAKNGDTSRAEEGESLPVKKKQKDNNSKGNDVIIIIEQTEKEKRMNGKSKSDKEKRKAEKKEKLLKDDSETTIKTRKSKSEDTTETKKKSRSKKAEEKAISSDDEEEVKQQGPEQYMELHINNDVDDDDGEGFSFFYVNDNVHNKTKHYFEKKIRPESICSCVGGCNDPTICACARFNFENCGKTTCFVYDTKYGKKRLLNPLLRKDMHIYECSSQCACTKSQCFNSCVNEGALNRTDVNSFVVERYKKVYKGQNPSLEECSATMWGLRSKDFIPANTYVVEYCGEIITKKEGDRRGEKYDSVNCNYLFDLNKHAEIEKIDHSNNTIILNIDGVCETRNISKLKDIAENFPLVIDAFFYGNHSRFVNHSCDPNMVALAVHTENRNILLPRIIFFALRDIQPGEELTIDYNCAPLKDLKNTDQMVCLCGAAQCRGYVYEEAKEGE